MNKKIIIIALSLLIITSSIIATTYSVIINVTNKEETIKILNEITIKDLLVNEDGKYNETYYNIKNTMNITKEEADLLINSNKLNDALDEILLSVANYKLNNSNKLTNTELKNIIINATYQSNLDKELTDKVILNTNIYIEDIDKFLYNLEVSLIGEV